MGSEGTYAEVSAAMASMNLKYRSVKFMCEDKDVRDVDIVRALMVQCDVEEIERVHPMPGNYWVVSFTTSDMAEEAQNGFILKEKRIHPVLMAKHFVTATVAYTPPDATLGDIERALERYAEVISIKDLYVRDFPGIKNGKQRVVLKPREGKLPAFFQVGRYKASLSRQTELETCMKQDWSLTYKITSNLQKLKSPKGRKFAQKPPFLNKTKNAANISSTLKRNTDKTN